MTRIRADDGASLVELLVAAVVASVVALIAFAALASTQKTEKFTDEDSRALTELRNATQRLVRELRQSGKVYPSALPDGSTVPDGSTAKRIHFWVDYNRDGFQNDQERIIWELALDEGRGVLTRKTRAAPTPVTLAEDLRYEDAFVYNIPPARTTAVSLTLTADIDAEGGPPARRVRTNVRLRSAPGSGG